MTQKRLRYFDVNGNNSVFKEFVQFAQRSLNVGDEKAIASARIHTGPLDGRKILAVTNSLPDEVRKWMRTSLQPRAPSFWGHVGDTWPRRRKKIGKKAKMELQSGEIWGIKRLHVGNPERNTNLKTKTNRSKNMAKAMTKAAIVTSIAATANLNKKQVAAALEALTNLAYKNAKNGFTVPGLGKLVLVSRKKREGRNPATGEKIIIPAKKVVKFRIAKAAKDAILGTK